MSSDSIIQQRYVLANMRFASHSYRVAYVKHGSHGVCDDSHGDGGIEWYMYYVVRAAYTTIDVRHGRDLLFANRSASVIKLQSMRPNQGTVAIPTEALCDSLENIMSRALSSQLFHTDTRPGASCTSAKC